MPKKLKYILSIAGHDPSGGAGVLADIKVFEHHQLMGFGVVTSITFQNDAEFNGLEWIAPENIFNQLKPLFKYDIDVIKIGLIENLEVLLKIIDLLKKRWPEVKIIWDPILKASAGYEFHSEMDLQALVNVLNKIYLITPNYPEMEAIGSEDALTNALKISNSCFVFLKGGHHSENANDLLIKDGKVLREYKQGKIYGIEKHGSGCVLSSAIAAGLVLGKDVETSCRDAKEYTLDFLISNETLLGQHNNPLIA